MGSLLLCWKELGSLRRALTLGPLLSSEFSSFGPMSGDLKGLDSSFFPFASVGHPSNAPRAISPNISQRLTQRSPKSVQGRLLLLRTILKKRPKCSTSSPALSLKLTLHPLRRLLPLRGRTRPRWLSRLGLGRRLRIRSCRRITSTCRLFCACMLYPFELVTD